jgi:dihydrofolate reductase
MIYARARNGVIGKQGQLPWHLPEDLAHFKRTTLGQPVVMGRVTWESLPEKFRPLPGRSNVVVSRQTSFSAAGAQLASSLEAAMALFPPTEIIWLIGGAQLYAQGLSIASQIVLTEIDADYEGDAFAPLISSNDWAETHRTSHVSAQGLAYHLVTLQKRNTH